VWVKSTAPVLRVSPTSYTIECNQCLGHSEDLILFRRPVLDEEIRFIQEEVVNKGALGWILGPPGTGKSVAAFLYASLVDKADWSVVWIKLRQDRYPVCFILEGNNMYTAHFSANQLPDFLNRLNSPEKCLMFVDGYLRTDTDHVQTLKSAMSWRDKDRINRRLVVVTSMASRGKVSEGDDIEDRVQEFLVYSWTLNDYLEAFKIPDLVKSVSPFMDAAPGMSLQQIVEDKFYYAGGCARYMCQFRTAEVIKRIKEAVKSIPSQSSESLFMPAIRAGTTINRLFSLYQSEDPTGQESLVSAFAASEIAVTVGPSELKNILSVLQDDVSGSGAGSMLETFFCCKLRSGGVELTFRNGSSVILRSASIRKIETKSDLYEVQAEEWLKPRSERNPGYDLVYVNKMAGMVRFVQLTRCNKHTFDLTPCREFLHKLEDSGRYRIVEFYFVVSLRNLATFQVQDMLESPVEGRGSLDGHCITSKKEMAPPWLNSDEKQHVTIAGMEDVF
jgi:hypothetical protein